MSFCASFFALNNLFADFYSRELRKKVVNWVLYSAVKVEAARTCWVPEGGVGSNLRGSFPKLIAVLNVNAGVTSAVQDE